MIDDEVFSKQHSKFQRVMAPGVKTVRPFGAGHCGLDEASNAAILTILSWDYMGAAEFENGDCGKCLVYMYDHRAKLVKSEFMGFSFLAMPEVTSNAHTLWKKIVNKEFPLRHSPAIDNPKILGWFDIINGFFVGRTPAMRDAVNSLLLTMDDQ